MKSLSLVRLFETPWTAAYQAPPSMGFSRQEYWSGVPLPSPSKMSTDTLKLKEDVVHAYSGPQLNHENRHCNYEIIPLVTTRMDLGGSDTSQADRGRK